MIRAPTTSGRWVKIGWAPAQGIFHDVVDDDYDVNDDVVVVVVVVDDDDDVVDVELLVFFVWLYLMFFYDVD